MSMSHRFHRSILSSFQVAILGLFYAFSTQRNMRFHGFTGLVAVALGLFFGLRTWEWAYLCLSIFLVLISEIFNTAIEVSIDLVTRKPRARAMLAKDLAAGAVLMASIQALIAAYLIFFSRFVTLIR